MNIDLSKLIIKKYYNAIHDIIQHKYTHYWLKGGRGSTKSSFISIAIILLIITNKNINALVIRKVAATLKDSVYSQILWAIDILGLGAEFETRVNPLMIIYKRTNQKIYFRGADEPLKIKSIKAQTGYIGITWFEELDQFNGAEEIRNILQSANRGGDKFWNFYGFNPPKSRDNWANVEVLEPRKDKIVIHNSYLDVPAEWLGKQFIIEAEILKKNKPMSYEHEYLGIATGTGGSIFDNVEGQILTEKQKDEMEYFYYGCDFGYAKDPFVWLQLSYDSNKNTLYILDEIFSVEMTITRTIDLVKQKQPPSGMYIIADSASPQLIREFVEHGILMYGCKKGADVKERGIKWLQDLDKIIIDQVNAPNALREFTNYEYAMDKFNNFISDYPDKNNHTIDATRYAMENLIRQRKIKYG